MLWLPNLLSISRIFIVGCGIWFLHLEGPTLRVYCIIAGAFVTDFADGLLARRLQASSEIGRVLDPLADKIAMAIAVLYAVFWLSLPVWFTILIIARDVLILIGGIIIHRRIGKVLPSLWIGKWAVFFIGIAVTAYLFNWYILQKPLVYAAVIWILLSFSVYSLKFVRVLHSEADSN